MGAFYDDKILNKEGDNYISYKKHANSNNTVTFSDIENKVIEGIPIAFFEEDDLIKMVIVPFSHAIVLGSTRSGKTTSLIIPLLVFLIRSKALYNFCATDIKGELYPILAPIMKRYGVMPVVINFRDIRHTESYNPIAFIYDLYQEILNIEDGITSIKDGDDYFYVFEDERYSNLKSLKVALEKSRKLKTLKCSGFIDDLATEVVKIESTTDTYWESSAKELFKAIIYGMLEDSDGKYRKLITRAEFSFQTIINILSTFSMDRDSERPDCGYFTTRDKSSISYKLARPIIISNANNTRQCIFSTLMTKLGPYNEAVSQTITSKSTFSFEELIESKKKFGLFIICRDEVKTSYNVIQLIVSRFCTILTEKAQSQLYNCKLEHPFFFVLDEFGNFPKITDFDNKISISAGRNIYFILAIQSYSQLTNVYGSNSAIVRDNANITYFFGSNNYDTKMYFSQSCGVRKVMSAQCLNVNPRDEINYVYDYVEKPNVSIKDLNELKPGDCYIQLMGKQSIKSVMERYFMWNEKIFTDNPEPISQYVMLRNRDDYYKNINTNECEFGV